MAIAKGKESVDAKEYKRYIGVTPVYIKAINPDKAAHEELFGVQLEEAPKYVTDAEDNNGKSYKNVRVSVVLEPVEPINGDKPLITMAMFLQNRPRVGGTSGKIQVIDKYGRTAWATPTEVETHAIPVYSNGPADLDKDYRPAYVGEEELMALVKTYLRIPEPTVWDNNSRTRVPNTKVKSLEECECRFDNLDKVFSGDFSEIREALGYQPTNKVKVMLGVRTDPNTGKMYQSVYTRRFYSNNATNFAKWTEELQDMISNAVKSGKALNTEYSVDPVHEYTVAPTVIAPVEEASAPVAEDDAFKAPWE